MKIRRSRYYSLSTKLSVTTSLIASVVIIIIALYVQILKSDQVISSDKHDIELSLSNTALTINKRSSLVESALNSNLWNIKNYARAEQTDSISAILSHILDLNSDILGCGIVFKHGDDTDALPYIIYISRNAEPHKQELPMSQITSREGDFNWLAKSATSKAPDWTNVHSEPFEKAMKVCSYTIPITINDKGEEALLFADLQVNTVGKVINDNQTEYIVKALLIDNDGKCIYKSNYKRYKSNDIYHLSQATIAELTSHISEHCEEGEHGSFDITINGDKHLTFYDVVNDSGWVLFYLSDFSPLSSDLAKSSRGVALIFVVMILMLFFVLSFVIKRMTMPLKQFSDSAIEISKGNFNVELPKVDTNDEMATLRNSFDKMQRSIVKYTKELEESAREQAFISSELQVASRIQDDLLPKTFPPFPERDDIDIRAKLIPAKVIGGDLYNYFIRDNKVYFIVADVSGKSVPAALVMAIANNMFNTISPQTNDPAAIMNELNITTCANNESSGFFITALVGILDLSTSKLQLCNAGHDPAILLDDKGNISLLKIKPNLPVGVINGYNYASVTLDLTGRTRLIMYTDGITEAENTEGRFFGTKALLDCIGKNRDNGLTEMVDDVVNEVNTFANDNERADDITIMVLDYKPSDKPMPKSITIFNDIREIAKVHEFADAVADVMELDDSSKLKLNLALEEAVSNIIQYSTTHSGHNIITMYASAHKGAITVIISDRGTPFDPTAAKSADTEAPLESRPVGGLGITLIRTIAEDMKYLRQNNHNYLTLKFNFFNNN